MVEVSMEVRSGSARFFVAVRAESVERAVSLVGGRYSGEVRARVRAGSEGVLVDGRAPRSGIAASRRTAAMAA